MKKFFKKVFNKFIVDPSVFDDPVAMKVKWTPLKNGGSRMATHALLDVRKDRREFRILNSARNTYLVIIILGLCIFVGALVAWWLSWSTEGGPVPVLILVGMIMASVGGSLLYFGSRPIVFDKSLGFFWKGRAAFDDVRPASQARDSWDFTKVSLDHIYALQILSEFCSQKSGTKGYWSFELNLVLRHGSRLNVVDHGNANKL